MKWFQVSKKLYHILSGKCSDGNIKKRPLLYREAILPRVFPAAVYLGLLYHE